MAARSDAPDIFTHAGPWTEEDFLALPDDGRRVELFDGAILMSASAARGHQRLSHRLRHALELAAPSNLEALEAINVRVARNRIMIPDLAIVTDPGGNQVVTDASRIAVAVEIESLGSLAMDRVFKPAFYASAGIPTYLRIELDETRALGHVYHLTEGHYEAAEQETGQSIRLTRPFPFEADLLALASAPLRQSPPRRI